VLSYKVRPYPEPFLFYFCNSDYFTIYKHVYTKETCFPKFFSIFLTKKRKFTTKGKTNARRRGGGGMVSYFKVKNIVEIANFRP